MRINTSKFISILSSVIWYIAWAFFFNHYEQRSEVTDQEVQFWSWVGIVFCVYYIVKRWIETKKILTILNIFLAFFIVFNFGQCLLWAFDIHTKSEIGKGLIFSTVSCDNRLIVMAQLVFIICFVALNCAVNLMSSKSSKGNGIILPSPKGEESAKTLFKASFLVSIIVIPVTLFYVALRFYLAQQYGYRDLYYGASYDILNHSIYNISISLFLPCLIGLLLGSNYSKKTVWFCYSVFLIYAIVLLLTGDRGEWIVSFLVLFFCHITYYKRISPLKMAGLLIIAIFGVFVMHAVVSLRSSGLTWEGFLERLMGENNALVSMLMEFGHTMGISIILLKEQVVSPYGNTILMAFPTMFSTGLYNKTIGALLNNKYVQLYTWFPQDYLKIDYGTDFSMIGEAMLNFGVYLTPFIIFIEGLIIAKIAITPSNSKSSIFKKFMCLSVMPDILLLPRTTLWTVLNGMLYIVLIFSLVYFVLQRTGEKSGKVRTRL